MHIKISRLLLLSNLPSMKGDSCLAIPRERSLTYNLTGDFAIDLWMPT